MSRASRWIRNSCQATYVLIYGASGILLLFNRQSTPGPIGWVTVFLFPWSPWMDGSIFLVGSFFALLGGQWAGFFSVMSLFFCGFAGFALIQIVVARELTRVWVHRRERRAVSVTTTTVLTVLKVLLVVTAVLVSVSATTSRQQGGDSVLGFLAGWPYLTSRADPWTYWESTFIEPSLRPMLTFFAYLAIVGGKLAILYLSTRLIARWGWRRRTAQRSATPADSAQDPLAKDLESAAGAAKECRREFGGGPRDTLG